MELSKQCVSFEIAKKLKELWVKQNSYFSWTEQEWYTAIEHWELRRAASWADIIASAFTVAELWELMKTKNRIASNYVREEDDWVAFMSTWDAKKPQDYFYCCNADTEADARWKLLIYLLENKLMTI